MVLNEKVHVLVFVNYWIIAKYPFSCKLLVQQFV